MMPDEWFFVREGERFGPVAAAVLKKMADEGTLTGSDMVSKRGLGKWVPAASVKGLCVAAASTQLADDGEETPIFADGPVILTSQRLTIGANEFERTNVQGAALVWHVRGSVGAYVALGFACYLYVGALGQFFFWVAVSVVQLFIEPRWAAGGFVLSLIPLASCILPRLLTIPASTLWRKSKGEYRLVIKTRSARVATMASELRQNLEPLVVGINRGLGVSPELADETEPGYFVRFLVRYFPLLFPR